MQPDFLVGSSTSPSLLDIGSPSWSSTDYGSYLGVRSFSTSIDRLLDSPILPEADSELPIPHDAEPEVEATIESHSNAVLEPEKEPRIDDNVEFSIECSPTTSIKGHEPQTPKPLPRCTLTKPKAATKKRHIKADTAMKQACAVAKRKRAAKVQRVSRSERAAQAVRLRPLPSVLKLTQSKGPRFESAIRLPILPHSFRSSTRLDAA